MLRTIARHAPAPHLHEFALSYDQRIAAELRSAGCPVHLLGEARASQPFSVRRARANLAELCRDRKFDATIVHSAWSLALLAPAATRPLVLYQHDISTAPAWSAHYLTGLWSRRAKPDLVIANSRTTAASISGIYKDAPIVTIYPCVEPNVSQDHTRIPKKEIVLLQASRFEPWKGHSVLLESLARLRANPNWSLRIAGHPQRPAEILLRNQLQADAQRYGIADRITFLGHVDDMASVMRAADIYCQPNTGPEPFGLTFIEALQAGLPIVTTAIGGAKEILEPDWGLLAEPRPESIAAAIERLIQDPSLRESLAASGPARAHALCHPSRQIQALHDAISQIAKYQAAA
jgi:glycosyltransferase involved in cell wall biosynthesis